MTISLNHADTASSQMAARVTNHRGGSAWAWFCGLAGSLLVGVGTVSAASFPPSEQVFPGTTCAWLSVPDPSGLQEQFDATSYGGLLRDPSMQEFMKSFREQLAHSGKQRLSKLGLTLEDLGTLPGGEIAVAAIRPEEGRLATVLLVDVTGHEQEASGLVERIGERLVEQKAVRLDASDSLPKVTVYRLPPEEGVPAEAARERLAAFVLDGASLVVGDDPVQVHHVHSVLEKGRQDCLAAVEAFAKVTARTQTGLPETAAVLQWYIDPFVYAAAYREANPPREKRKGPDYLAILGRQGFDAVKAMGGRFAFRVGPYELQHQTMIYAPPLPGRDPASPDRYDLAARMLRFPDAAEIEPPSWVPQSVSSWIALQWDIQTAFGSAESLVDDVVGEKGVFDDVIASLKEDPDGPQIDVEADLIRGLGQRVSVLSDYVTPIGIDSERLVIAIEAVDPERVAATVAKSMSTDPDMQRIESNGAVIWELIDRSMEIPKLEIETPGGVIAHADHEDEAHHRRGRLREREEKLLPHSAVTVAHGHLLIASHRDFLERVLSASEGSETLASMPDCASVGVELRKLFPAGIALQSFGRTDESIRPAYEMLKQGSMPKSKSVMGQLLNGLLGDGKPGSVRAQKIDGSSLPDFELIRRYFGASGIGMETIDDGWFLRGIAMPREQGEQAVARRPVAPVGR
jgi:hypothetical protein